MVITHTFFITSAISVNQIQDALLELQTYLIPEIYAEDYQSHFICGLETTGQEGVLEFISGHRQAFPDWTEKVVDIVADGDRVVTHYISPGTHEDEF